MKLYNTPARQVEKIKPQDPARVTVYTCGPTVYDYSHIGHWFTYVRMDTLIRVLKAAGLSPKWVMNITDVGHLVSDADEGEDKLEVGARREGKTAWEIAKFYTDDFLKGMRQLNMLTPDSMPRATDHIDEQIKLIQKLEQKGFAYIIDDGVYYDTAKFPAYEAFARLNIKEQQAGARVEANPQKRNVADFALWKFSPKDKKRDMEWDSPWGKGFPGWHTECSAMSMAYLGQTIDIHTGGIDHIPVHHTNEIAQSEAATGKEFANYWMHANHVLVDGEKISKSLNNGIRLREIFKKGISPSAVRLHILESHYRTQAHFSWESLEAAQNRLHTYQALADLVWQVPSEARPEPALLSAAREDILSHLADDLNTPAALARLSQLETESLQIAATADHDNLRNFMVFLDGVFGLDLAERKDLSQDQYRLLKERETARHAQVWAQADELRDQLASQGIGLRDTETGAIWYRL